MRPGKHAGGQQAGHGGPSGREKRWRDIAFEYGFLVDLARTADARRPLP